MALAPTLYDFSIELHQVDAGVEQKLQLKTARHPSETLERVWLRVLAYCWKWEERLTFGPGLSDPDAPDLLATDLTGELTHWIRVGKAEPAKIQKVLDRNSRARVTVLFDAPARMEAFVEAARAEPKARWQRLELGAVEPTLVAALAREDSRRSKLTLTLVDDQLYIDKDGETLEGPLARASLD